MYLVGENQGLIVVNRGLIGQCGKSNIESLIWDIDMHHLYRPCRIYNPVDL